MRIVSYRRPVVARSWPAFLVAGLALAAPRLAVLFWWLVDPARWQFAFRGHVVLPLAGVLVFPWTTLMALLIAAPDQLSDQHWIWLGVALLLDLLMYDRDIWRMAREPEAIQPAKSNSGRMTSPPIE